MRLKTGESSFLAVRAGLQNVLQIFVTNAANVFLLEVSPEYPILLEEQVTINLFFIYANYPFLSKNDFSILY
jgi:hypothetical protein